MSQSYFRAGVRELRRIIAGDWPFDGDVESQVLQLLADLERASGRDPDLAKALVDLPRKWQDWLFAEIDAKCARPIQQNASRMNAWMLRAERCLDVLRRRSFETILRNQYLGQRYGQKVALPFPLGHVKERLSGDHFPFDAESFPSFSTLPPPGSAPPLVPLPPAPPVGAPAPPVESRYLKGRAPVAVRAADRFIVHAQIDIQADDGLVAPLAAVAIPASGLTVTLEVVTDPEQRLSCIGAGSVDVIVMPGTATKEVEFHFLAHSLGEATVTVRAFAGQKYLGDLAIGIEVVAHKKPGEQRIAKNVTTGPSPATDVTLSIDYDSQSNCYRFDLRGDGKIGYHKYQINLAQQPVQIIKELMDELNALARNGKNISAHAAELKLAGIGAALWDTLLPKDLQAKLQEHWDDIARLTFLAQDDLIPWELVYCPEHEAFLADRWLICRWRYGDSAPRLIADGPTLYVVPNNAPTSADDEIAGLRKILPSKELCRKLAQLVAALEAAKLGILHVAAHNSVQPDQASRTQLMLDEPFSLMMLTPFSTQKRRFKNAPVVFLNACSSAAEAEHWVGSDGWAGKFLKAGAGAFLGSLWEVRDRSAAIFATTFYENAKKGVLLGESFRMAREAINQKGDPTRFAYTFFGNPDASFSTAMGDPHE